MLNHSKIVIALSNRPEHPLNNFVKKKLFGGFF